MKNLVLGFATNQLPADCKVFINSLRQVYAPSECDGVLFIDTQPSGFETTGRNACIFVTATNSYPHRTAFERKAKSFCIRAASAASRFRLPWIRRLAKLILECFVERWHHPHFARWLAYRRFLEDYPDYDQVLLSDVRDVLFQRPFFSSSCEKVQFFEQSMIYGDDNCDSTWYRDAWGRKAFSQASGNPIICIGTVIGPRDEILKFVNEFIDYFLQDPFRGVEQAIFNHMILSGAPKFKYDINLNTESIVLTMANPDVEAVISILDGEIATAPGTIVPIVHMYDRFDSTMAVAQSFTHAGN